MCRSRGGGAFFVGGFCDEEEDKGCGCCGCCGGGFLRGCGGCGWPVVSAALLLTAALVTTITGSP